MSDVAGCRIEPLDVEASRKWLQWILRKGEAPRAVPKCTWLLAHCDSGVTWGRMEEGVWQLGSDAFPYLCPVPDEASLQELRLFSEGEETLIWRTSDGPRGRLLSDDDSPPGGEPTHSAAEDRLLLAARAGEQRDGFTRVGDGTGAEQALPLLVTGDPPSPWPLLRVRHYFTRDKGTGAVRVAATRLVEVK